MTPYPVARTTCPMCGINSCPRMVYGEHATRRYVCDSCRDRGQDRADAMEPEISRLRAARLERQAVWQVDRDRNATIRKTEQQALIERYGGQR